MVYDKDYYELLTLIENKIQSIENKSKEIILPNNLKIQLEDVKKAANEAYESIEQLIKDSGLSEDSYANVVSKFEQIQDISKQISALQQSSNGNNQLAASEIVRLNAELLKLTGDIGDELGMQGASSSDIIQHASDLYDKYKDQKIILEDSRRTLIKIEREQSKILEQAKEWKENVDGIKKGYQQFTGALKKSFNLIKDSTEFWRKQDEQITKMVATFGLTNDELDNYRKASYKAGKELAFQYGKTQEDMIKLQQGYAEATGKNIVLTKDNYDAQFQLQQLMGEEDSLAFTSGIEQFGVGINDARDRLYDIYKLNKSTGVSWSKTSKELNNNLKLAQKYNFKGGLENMMKMTVWANKMKINLQTIGSIADKISNPEGAIETAAKLQVLGGAFSSMANPLQMLYESLDDVGGLAQRVEKMFDGLGRFDRDLGEVRIAGPDRMRVKAAAEAMGMSYEEAMGIVNNKAKREAVEQDVRFNPEITKENRDFLATLGQWNNTNKQFEVRTYDEKNREYVNRNINELSNEEIEKLRQEPDDDIRKLVENTFSINANIDKLVNGAKMALAATQEDKYGETFRNQLKNGNDMLSQMEHLGETLDAFYNAAIAYYAVQGIGGAFKIGKGLFDMGKMVKGGKIPNTFGGQMANNMMGKGAAVKGVGIGKFVRGGGVVSGLIAAGTGIYSTYNDAKDAENQRATAIANGDLIEGSAEDKKVLRDIKKLKRTGYSGAAGSGIGAGLGAWGGAAAGAAIGSIVPGIGTAIGGVIGGILGGIGGGWVGNKAGAAIGDAISVDDGIANKRTVVKANKDDTALFAKDNGPFDKLFGNIIPKIDNIDNELSDSKGLKRNNNKVYGNAVNNQPEGFKLRNKAIGSVNSELQIKDNEHLNKMFGNIVPKIDKNLKISNELYYNNKINDRNVNITKVSDNKNDIIIPKPIGEDFHKIKETTIKDSNSLANIKLPDINVKPIELKLGGSLKLDMGSAGQVDIMKELKGNPTFMRELSRMLVEQMSSSLNGGKPKLDQNRFARFQS